MNQTQVQEKIEQLLSKPNYKFHALDSENMIIYENVEATPSTAYYQRREKLDIMNDLFEEEIKYTFDNEKGVININ